MTAQIVQEALNFPDPHPDTNTARKSATDRRRCDERCAAPTPSQAHCGACHVTFGGVSGFDSHRRNGECVDPASLGMVADGQVWRRTTDRDAAAIFRGVRDAR